MAGKAVLITGATSGIGFATARRLAALGATVIVHGPHYSDVAATQVRLRLSVPQAHIETVVADLSSQAAVRGLAAEVQGRFGQLDVLINNAAAVFDRWTVNGDNIELTFAVNHLAPYLATRLLLPMLEQSPQGRVVFVGSEAHRDARIDLDDLGTRNDYERFRAYSRSKLANLLFNLELSRRMARTRVATNAGHPGTVRTGLFRPRNVFERIAMPIIDLKAVAPEAGADTSVWLASADDPRLGSGGYYHQRRLVEPSAEAQDGALASLLWDKSAELTGLPA